MIGLILLCAIFAILYFVFYSLFEKNLVSLTCSFVCVNAVIVFIAELLGVFHLYALIPVYSFLVGIAAVSAALFRQQIVDGVQKAKINLKDDLYAMTLGGWLIAGFIIIIVLIATIKNSIYPPRNYDSLNFHCIRALYYWKSHSLDNFSFSLAPALYYYPPLNAILMSLGMIFAHGSDRLMNFVQLPSWIFAMYSIGGITEHFLNDGWITDIGSLKSGRAKYVPMAVAISIPIALFQLSTTQNDLLAANFSVICIYCLIQAIEADQVAKSRLLCLMGGLSGGLAFLSKITSAAVLLTAGCYFLYRMMKDRQVKKEQGIAPSLIRLSFIAVGGIAVCLGTFIRNAIDLNGDITGLTAFKSVFKAKVPFALNVLMNTGYCFGSRFERIADWNDQVVKGIGNLFWNGNSRLGNFKSWMIYYEHDCYPYAVQMWCIVIAAVAVSVLAIRRKKRNVMIYMLLGTVSWIINAGFMNGFICSMRYLLPCVFQIVPMTALLAVAIFEKVSVKKSIEKAWEAIVYMMMVLLIVYGCYTQINDHYMRLVGYNKEWNYDQWRYRGDNIGPDIVRKIMDIISGQEGLVKVGIQEDVMNGIYPLIYEMRGNKYEVEYINSAYRNVHEPTSFEPDYIIYIAGKDGILEDAMTYHNQVYSACTDAYETIYGYVKMYAILGRR